MQSRDSKQLLNDINDKINKRREMFDVNDRSGKKTQMVERDNNLENSERKKVPESQFETTGYELIEQSKWSEKRLMEVIELELELAESQLASRMSRKKEYKAKVIEITQANERKWLLKQGKGDCLDFKDE